MVSESELPGTSPSYTPEGMTAVYHVVAQYKPSSAQVRTFEAMRRGQDMSTHLVRHNECAFLLCVCVCVCVCVGVRVGGRVCVCVCGRGSVSE